MTCSENNVITKKNILISVISLIITYLLRKGNKHRKRKKNKSTANTYMKTFRFLTGIFDTVSVKSVASDVKKPTVEFAEIIEL